MPRYLVTEASSSLNMPPWVCTPGRLCFVLLYFYLECLVSLSTSSHLSRPLDVDWSDAAEGVSYLNPPGKLPTSGGSEVALLVEPSGFLEVSMGICFANKLPQ